jgi:methionyl-tRNA formyltransferase
MKIVFMGTPEFAVPPLQALFDGGYDVAAVFTQPDRPAGRGKALMASPVKQSALRRGVPVCQFERVRRQEGIDALRAIAPDLIVTAAFGQILSQKILDIPPLGTVNVHASLLPKRRGAAPIQWSVIQGDATTGVTTMYTDIGIDTGDMIFRRETEIGPDETSGELTERLSRLGAALLIDTLRAVARGDAPRVKQDDAASSYDKPIDKDIGHIDFSRGAEAVKNLVRGVNPRPGAYALFPGGEKLKIWAVRAREGRPDAAPGTVIAADAKAGLLIQCGEGAVEVLEMQAPNAKRMAAKAYLMGKGIPVGTEFYGRGSFDGKA